MDRFFIQQKCYFSNPLSSLQKLNVDDKVIEEPSFNYEKTFSQNSIVIIQSLHSKTIIESFEVKVKHKQSWRDDFTWL